MYIDSEIIEVFGRSSMRRLRTAILLAFAGLLFLSGASAAYADPDAAEEVDLKPHYAPLSVVEVFITGDCKSCLQTLKVLNEIESNTGTRRGQSLFLAYNLVRTPSEEKYFDHAGSLSREQISKRWSSYADLFKMKNVAVPELIVNGRKFLSKSKPDVIEKSISRALLTPSKVAVSLELGKVAGDTVQVKYSVAGLPKSRRDDLYTLTIAAVRPRMNVPVYTADGVDVEQLWANLVEALDTVRVEEDDASTIDLHMPEDARLKVKELVAILQDARTGKPVAGESIRVKLPGPSK